MEKMITREMKIWMAATVFGLFLAMAIATYTQAYAENVQNEIADNVIRFHVLANSDSPEDQALKNFVRDGVLDRYRDKLDPAGSIEDTRTFLLEHLEEVQEYAEYLVQSKGFNYPVYGVVDRTFFPTRVYEDIAFPAGEYEALRIVIGEGRGSNWWCVMFPPLCYVDAATPAPDDHTVLRNLVSDQTYAVMNHSQGNTGVTVRFKVVEWWQEQMHQQPGTMYLQH